MFLVNVIDHCRKKVEESEMNPKMITIEKPDNFINTSSTPETKELPNSLDKAGHQELAKVKSTTKKTSKKG